jgi:integrase
VLGCEACHGPNGQGGIKDRLVGGQGTLASDAPIKTIGSYWPYAAVRAWLEASNITTGPLFRPIGKGGRIGTDRLADHTVVRVVKASARRVGLDPKLFAGHSLRSGFLTSAAGRGASIFKMMDVSRHKSMDTLRGHVRDAELFRDHAGAGLL